MMITEKTIRAHGTKFSKNGYDIYFFWEINTACLNVGMIWDVPIEKYQRMVSLKAKDLAPEEDLWRLVFKLIAEDRILRFCDNPFGFEAMAKNWGAGNIDYMPPQLYEWFDSFRLKIYWCCSDKNQNPKIAA